MRTQLALGLVLATVAGAALAEEKARPRSGGSSAAVGSRHHSGSSHSGGSRSVSQGSSRAYGDSATSRSSHGESATLSDAQRRHPRPGYGSGSRGRYHGRGYYPYYYGYYRPYYAWGFWPYYDYWGYPYYYGGGYWGPRYAYYRDGGSVRVLVDPEQTRVYVDGYYAGIADEFDGLFQRLHVSPGRHEIALKLEGYRTHRMKVYVPYDGTLKIHHDMVRGEGESAEDLVGPDVPERDEREEWARRDREDREYDRDAWRERAPREREREGVTLRLSVRPDDASVYVDGEFRGSGRQARVLRLAPGRHRIEVVRPGYRTWDQEVEVGPEGSEVTVELARP